MKMCFVKKNYITGISLKIRLPLIFVRHKKPVEFVRYRVILVLMLAFSPGFAFYLLT